MKTIGNSKCFILYLLFICGFYACASIGSPGGGDYDITPPVFVESDPAPNTVLFNKNKISLLFNEYIVLEKPSETVIITPPQKKMPVIKAVGKKIIVELKDSLLPHITYTFDFTNGIVDNNEKNVLEGFHFAFSTGDVVDSLVISGILLNAENLEPMPHTMVGIHSDLSDTAFTKLPFLRTSQTNERGRFSIRNVAPGTYRLFALGDINRSFRFDLPDKSIAFYDSLIVPAFEPAMRMDTIWKDSLTVDTIREIHYTRFTPDNVLLQLFQEKVAMQYLSKTERNDSVRFTLTFNEPVEELPAIDWIDEPEEKNGGYLLEQSSDRKILSYWLMDSTLYRKDTLRFAASYLAHDTLKNLIPFTDTIQLIKKKSEPPKDNKDNKKNNNKERPDRLDVKITANGVVDVFDTVKITFPEPLAPFSREQIRISQKVDTLWESRDFPLVQDSLNPRTYCIAHPWPYEQEYQIRIDSAALVSLYGKTNDSVRVNFKTKAEKDYGLLIINLSGNKYAGFGQLLDNGDKPVKTVQPENGELVFFDIKPGKYYLRYIEDANANGKWDTGNYAEHRQPESVYYYPESLDIKAWVEWEQAWNIQELPQEKQKPLEITKNKPKEKQQPKRDNSRKNETKGNSNRPTLSAPTGTSGRQTMAPIDS
ncbi:MAG: Ig-like domain-containing protein [Dysgonamonadaceae bacterium]|jgi:hypothetical protein|nr:Ig-like domain-containing protein [Dysgonamonadaceae bacterium]